MSEAAIGYKLEYFELKITDNHSDDFLRILSKNDLPFSFKKILGSRISLTYKRLNENLTTNLGQSFFCHLTLYITLAGPVFVRTFNFGAS